MIRNFVWTSYDKTKPTVTDAGVSYVIYGEEVCPTTGREHWQGYAELSGPVRFSTLKTRYPTLHIEKRMGSAKEAIDYCKKDGKWHEEGAPKAQGKRSDLMDLCASIDQGLPIAEIARSDPACFVRYHRGLERYRFVVQPDRDSPPQVEWRYGPTGTGKTRGPFDAYKHDGVYIKDGTPWWDGYQNEKTIIIDDFDGKWPFRDLLRLLDRYPYQGQTKGGYVKINSPRIIITCEFPPENFWCGNALAQVKRRLTTVTDVTEVGGNTIPPLLRQDATEILPDEINEPRRFLTSAHDNL